MRFACAILLMAAFAAAGAEPRPRLRADGNRIVDANGKEVVLRGVSLPYLSQRRDRSVKERIDMAVDDWRADVVRLPLYGPHRTLDPIQAHEKYLKEAVEHCVAKGVYCIIDLHFIDDLRVRRPHAHYFWHQIAPLYADNPNVLFELYNEDNFGGAENPRSWAEYKALIGPVAAMVRERAPETLLLIGCPRWNQDLRDIAGDPFPDPNVAYVWHFYGNHDRTAWKDAACLAERHPVFVTEFGWQNKDAPSHQRATTTDFGMPFMDFMAKHHVSWTAFCFDNEHKPRMFDAAWNVLGGEDYCGEAVRNRLRSPEISDVRQ